MSQSTGESDRRHRFCDSRLRRSSGWLQDLRKTGSVTARVPRRANRKLEHDAAKALGLPNANGALVTDVIAGSPAEKAGFKRGDVVLKMNGQAIKDNRDLSRRIAALEVGRNGDVHDLARQPTDHDHSHRRQARSSRRQRREGRRPDGNANLDVRLTSMGLGLKTITPELIRAFSIANDATAC